MKKQRQKKPRGERIFKRIDIIAIIAMAVAIAMPFIFLKSCFKREPWGAHFISALRTLSSAQELYRTRTGVYGDYFDMVHEYAARTMLHMCGCCEAFLPRLIELGMDVYDVVQPTTLEMDIGVLKERFGEELTFCGSVCVQTTLAWGTVKDVEDEVNRRLKLFPRGGLFLGPTHAVQVGSPLENTLAMYRTAGSLCEQIDDSILSIGGGDDGTDKIDLAKLF